jgi:glutamate dehydrogenase (NAD(P)+)
MINSILEKRTSDNMLLKHVLDNFFSIVRKGNINEELANVLSNSEKKLEISIPIQMDDGSIKSFQGYRVQHSTVLGPAIGSLSMFNANIEECEALAIIMSLHNGALGIPLGGSKGIINCNSNDLSKDEIDRLYKGYINEISFMLGDTKDIIKLHNDPKAFTAYPIIDALNKNKLGINSVVNRPIDYFSTGLVNTAHSISIAKCVKNILDKFQCKDLDDLKIGLTVEDDEFDKNLLYELRNMGLKIGDVQDSEYSCNDIFCTDIYDIVYQYDVNFADYVRVKDLKNATKCTNYDILGADVDILILQNPDLRITIDNVENIKTKFIIEANENLITSDAERFLELHGVIIIPDFISLGGILINSYIEWANYSNAMYMSYLDYKSKIDIIIDRSLEKMWKIKDQYEISTREASLLNGIQKISNILEKRGFVK